MSVNIKYKDTSIAELTDTGTKTLKTAGKYCEADIVVENTKDGGTTITDGIVVTARDADGYATEVDVYSCVGYREFGHDWNGAGAGLKLTKANFKTDNIVLYPYAFSGCSNLVVDDVSKITALGLGCLNFVNVTDGNFANVTTMASPCIRGVSTITDLKFPKVTEYPYESVFHSMSNLATIQLGSVGYGVTKTRYDTMAGITFTGTLTCYCVGSYVDTFLTNFRNYGGANATIVFKAAEDTTYNSTAYAAGDTILTSEVAAS